MTSPFKHLSKKAPEDKIVWEEVEGAFSCQEKGCYKTVGEAKYSDENQLLTWKCPEGHISKIEGFHIE